MAVAVLLFAVALLMGLAVSPQGAFAADQGASSGLAAGSADLGAVAGEQAGTTAEVEKSHAKTPTPVYAGATSMPVSSKATWTLKNCTIKVVSGAGVVSVKGRTVTAKKAGVAKIGVFNKNGVRVATRTVSVYKLSSVYLMQSCMKGKSNMCLDMDGASKANGAQMIVWGKNGGANQMFTFKLQSDGSYTVKSLNSGKLLDVSGASKKWGQNVIQWQSNGGKNQRWRLTVDASNRITFVNVNSGLVFDVNGGKADWGARMIQWGSNGGLNQKWKLISLSKYKLYIPVLQRATSGTGEFAQWKKSAIPLSKYTKERPKYALFDIDGDGVKELIVSNQGLTSLAEEEIKVYTLRSGRVVSSGTVSLFRHGRLSIVGGYDLVFVSSGPAVDYRGPLKGIVGLYMNGTDVRTYSIWNGYVSATDSDEPFRRAFGSGVSHKLLPMTKTSSYSALK